MNGVRVRSMDTQEDILDMNDEPTEKRQPVGRAQGESPGQHDALAPSAGQAPAAVVEPKRQWSRRKFMGASILGLVGLGGAAAVGGFELERWLQNGGLQGPMASTVQIGHLLRRAGFGASPQDLATYAELGFSGAVDRLLNSAELAERVSSLQVPDDALENSLKAL